MRVRELIDILRDQPPDLELELALVAPVEDDETTITVDRFPVDGVLPWTDEDTGEQVIWLICGDEEDVEAFLDAIEDEDEDEDDDHEGHDHAR